MALTKLDSAMVSIPAKIDNLTTVDLSTTNLTVNSFSATDASVTGSMIVYGELVALSGLNLSNSLVVTISTLNVADITVSDEAIISKATIQDLNNSLLEDVYATSTVVQNISGNWNNGYTTGTQYSLNSGGFVSVSSLVQSASSNWNGTYTTVVGNSSQWGSLNTVFNSASSDNTTPKFVYFGRGGHNLEQLNGYDIAFNPNAPWLRWFANLGNSAISGSNEPFPNSPVYVYPNEIKKIQWTGTAFSTLSTFKITNSENWDTGYTLLQTNSAIWNSTNTLLQTNSAIWNSTNTLLQTNSATWNYTNTLLQANSATWNNVTVVIPTITNYLSTNNTVLSSVTVLGNISVNTITPSINLTVKNNLSSTGNIFTSAGPVIVSSSSSESSTIGISAINNIIVMTQTAYDNLPVKLDSTYYIII